MAFIDDESGAVTANWVVLTAGIVGLALAAFGTIASGIGAQAGAIDASLRGIEMFDEFASTVEDAFEDGIGALWMGGKAAVADVPGFGGILGPFARSNGSETVSRNLGLERAGPATISFDLISMDTIDHGEGSVLYVDGREVARLVKGSGPGATPKGLVWKMRDVPGVTTTTALTASGRNMGGPNRGKNGDGWEGWHDEVQRVTIKVDRADANTRFGFGARIDSHQNDESVGIDNFSISRPGM